jgi:hypothetical protein
VEIPLASPSLGCHENTTIAIKMTEPKSRWGSLLSGAVAGLESRLDNILADDPSGTTKTKGEDEGVKKTKQIEANTGLYLYPSFEHETKHTGQIRAHPQSQEPQMTDYKPDSPRLSTTLRLGHEARR